MTIRIIAALAQLEVQILYGRGGGKSISFSNADTKAGWPISSYSRGYIIVDEIAQFPKEWMVKDYPPMMEPTTQHKETKQQRVARLRGTRW